MDDLTSVAVLNRRLRNGIPFELAEPKAPARKGLSYSDNFAFTRRGAWTH